MSFEAIQSEQIDKLFAALSKAQADITPALKDSANPFFKSKYADLASVWEACRNALVKNGLAVTQTIHTNTTGQMILLTTLGHASGQWMRSIMPIITSKPDIQSLGSAITYSRRYSLAAIVGVFPDEDDDGEKAMARDSKPKPKQDPVAPPKITAKQADELAAVMAQTSIEFRNKIYDFMKANKYDSYSSFSQGQFDAIYPKAVADRDAQPMMVIVQELVEE